jgi:tetratricopeptide (TPR) repeat protein
MIGRSEDLPELTHAADAVAGRCLERYGKVDAAIELLESSVKEGSGDPITADRLSLYYEHAGDFERAAEVVDLCFERSRDLRGFNRLLQTLAKRKDRCRSKAAQLPT